LTQRIGNIATNLLRVIFLRGSPERIHYSTKLFVVALLLAIIASGSAQVLYFADDITLTVLRGFCELTMFMVGVVLLTRKVARIRLARLMLVLVSISLLADVVLSFCGLLDIPLTTNIAHYVIGIAAIYGASNALHWAIKGNFLLGVAGIGGYVLVVTVLYETFRGLFAIIASG
jgi:hypothetical protein